MTLFNYSEVLKKMKNKTKMELEKIINNLFTLMSRRKTIANIHFIHLIRFYNFCNKQIKVPFDLSLFSTP